jgi:RNA polymerase subunit RPABC4/transcription elongation factor Spt4
MAVVVLHDWPYGPRVIDSWVREQLIGLGLDPDGVDNAQLWSCAIVRTDCEQTVEIEHQSHVGSEETHVHEVPEWLVEYHPLEAVVEHTNTITGIHSTLYACPSCNRLTDSGVCPHCGEDIANTQGPAAVFQTPEEIEDWFGADTPGMVVQFRCGTCDQFFGVEGAINHAVETEHTQFHRA